MTTTAAASIVSGPGYRKRKHETNPAPLAVRYPSRTEERFKGARTLGWTLLALSLIILACVLVVGVLDGVRIQNYLSRRQARSGI